MPTWRGNTYRFTVTAATAAAGDTYINNLQTFTVTDAIAGGTVLFCTGTGAPTASGNLVRLTGAGTNPIVFSAVTAPNTNWGTSTNWITDGTGAGVPTTATDAVFDNKSSACSVNVAAVCRNLNFNSGTGYVNTITMTNNITIGSNLSASPNHSVTLSSASFSVSGTGALVTRANGTTTLTGNGRTWPNPLNINTVIVTTNSIISLNGNWTNGGNVGMGPGSSITLTGAFNLTCNANLTINVGVLSSSTLTSTASLSTIVLAGNSTYTASAASIGVNLTINAPGNTVTLADGASYGGSGTQPTSAFTYVAGTVVCSGTFHLNFSQNGNPYTVNINGDPSTAATTTNTTGVNFSNLSLKTAAPNNASQCTFTSPICVVNDFSVTTTTGTKSFVTLLGSTIHVNKSFSNNGIFTTGSTTTIRLQGTGDWSESLTLTQITTGYGVAGPVVINTTGTITLTSFVGIRSGSLTYTAGSFVTTGYGLRLGNVSLNGLGSGGIIIPTVYYSTLAPSTSITITDTVPISITNLIFDSFNSNNAFSFLGNIGFIVGNFNFQQSSLTATSGILLANGVTYVVTNSFIFRALTASNSSNIMSSANGSTPVSIFTLNYGASQDVFGMGGRQINSQAGQTIWSRKGLLTATTNWQNWTYPKTRFSSFTS